MSDEEKPPRQGYLVGYGKPPAKHRFSKGKSGNPAGRPRRTSGKGGKFEYGMAPTRQLILDEAYRPITLRDGDHTLTMPTIQAVMRAMAMQALKGNRLAQKTLAEFVQKIEATDFDAKMTRFKKAIDYKDEWEAEFKRCDRLGIPRPEPIPHPDDILLDVNTAGVSYRGPLTREDKVDFDIGLEQGALVLKDIERLMRISRRRPLTEDEQAGIEWRQRLVDTLDAVLTPRYRKRLFGDDP